MYKTYITTAISYTNGYPHIGHAYEIICADVLNRIYQKEADTYFLTGTDEHGQKIAEKAEKMMMPPQNLCDFFSDKFKTLYKNLAINYSNFIRTTDKNHERIVKDIFIKFQNKDFIYQGEYKGYYSEREESFITELDAKNTNYLDPVTNKKYPYLSEPCYFFRTSVFRDQIYNYIKNNPNFIQSEDGRNQILNRLNTEELRDLSITRSTIEWGIKVTEKDVLYVWFDALINYISGAPNEVYQPAIHIIGKDILWFHAVIWPCMLLALDIELPKQIIVHGFINDNEGKKMSKSVGNVVDPIDLLAKYSSDEIRFYLCRTGKKNYDHDINFSYKELENICTSELANLYGNFIKRVGTLMVKFELPINKVEYFDNEYDIQNNTIFEELEKIILELHRLNKWIFDQAPWKSGNTQVIIESFNQTVKITRLLEPFIPDSCNIVLSIIKEKDMKKLSKLILFKKYL